MSRDWLIALASGVLSVFAAMAFMGGSPGSWFLVYLAPLPLLLAGLGLGPTAATVAGAGGIFTAGLTAGLLAAGFYGLIFVLPTWLVAQLAFIQKQGAGGTRLWFTAGWILSWLAVLAAQGEVLRRFRPGDGSAQRLRLRVVVLHCHSARHACNGNLSRMLLSGAGPVRHLRGLYLLGRRWTATWPRSH